MSGKGINSNALITSSSSCSSLVSMTHFTSSSASSSTSAVGGGSAEQCHSCHSAFTSSVRPICCQRCSRSYCDSCAPHAVRVRTAEADDERRMCNRCHDSLTQAALTSQDVSEQPDSRRTTKLGSDDSLDEPTASGEQKIFVTLPSPPPPAPALPPLPLLNTSTSANEPSHLFINEHVEATRELVSPAPSPAAPPPSPLSPLGDEAQRAPSPVSVSVVVPAPLKLTVRVPSNAAPEIRVLSSEEIARLERERKRKGLPDPNARMGSVVIGAPAPVVNGDRAAPGGEQERLVKRPWYACGCGSAM